MNNVSSIAERRQDRIGRQWTGQDAAAAQALAKQGERTPLRIQFAPTTAPAEALESSLDEYRATMLDLAHRRQAFEMQMLLESNTAKIKLEAAGYRALVAGVPENDIYGLGEDMAEALSSAMNTVAGA